VEVILSNYFLRVLLAIEIPSLTFALLSVSLINSEWFLKNLGDAKVKSTLDPISVLVIAPFVETFILALLIKLLSEKNKVKIYHIFTHRSNILHCTRLAKHAEYFECWLGFFYAFIIFHWDRNFYGILGGI